MRQAIGSFHFLTALGLALFSANSSSAFVQTLTDTGVPIRWASVPKLDLVGNPSNQSGITDSYFFTSITTSLQKWKEASGDAIRFDYWQGRDSGSFEPNSDYNGHSSIYFLSNANGATDLDSEILGVTQVWYDPGNGQILEADIALNDRDFSFSNQPNGSGIYLDNVITHELGHAFGLSHSGGLQNTMLFVTAPEQSHLSCDEWVGIRGTYGLGASQTGSISGRILGPQGQAILGAEVFAISESRGVAFGSAMTDRGGNYVIPSLEPGNYFLVVVPYYAGAANLSEYYAGSSSLVCSGRLFSRTFLESGTGFNLQTVGVSPGAQSGAGSIVVKCENSGGAAVSAHGGSQISNAPDIDASAGFGVVDRFSRSKQFYGLRGLKGNIDIHAMAYSLYSPVRAQMRLLDAFGNSISVSSESPVYRGDAGYVNYDASLQAQSLAKGNYWLEVTTAGLSSSSYAASMSLDTVPFVVLTGNGSGEEPPLLDWVPNHPECRLSERNVPYTSPGGGPPRNATASSRERDVGFCGTIQGPKGGGPGPSSGQIIGWFLPWLFMGLAARGVRIRLRFPT